MSDVAPPESRDDDPPVTAKPTLSSHNTTLTTTPPIPTPSASASATATATTAASTSSPSPSATAAAAAAAKEEGAATSTSDAQQDAMPSSSSSSSGPQSSPSSTAAPSAEPPRLSESTVDPTKSLQLSTAVASALPSAQTSPGTKTPEVTSTVSTLQLASEALSTIPQQQQSDAESIPPAAAELLTALHRKHKKAHAIQSPRPGSIRSRSAATTPVPPTLLLGLKHDPLDVTANSSQATTPTRTPSGRAKRQRRERNPATLSAVTSALPSLESNDRRRSARVAKAVTASASDSPNTPNLALFGFSPYLENLIMNAKETDRRTRSGGRGIRPPIDRAPTRTKRGAAKSKNKESDPDGPDDEAKSELYRQLCIISYQLQAHLDMVPHKTLDELRAQFATPLPDEDEGENGNLHPAGAASAIPGTSVNASRATTPATNANMHNSYDQPNTATAGTPMYAQHPPVIVKAEPPQSPRFSHLEPQHSQLHTQYETQEPPKQQYSPESSPEVALAQALRPPPPPSSHNHDAPHYSANSSYNQYGNGYQSRQSPEPYPWSAKVDEMQDEPMSPPFRQARGNIMSISALMDGPSRPSKVRTPSPELIHTPPRPIEQLPPPFMQEWTGEDEMASQFLSACAAAIPKLDTTELDRLTQIAQLAAFDLILPSAPSSPRNSTPSQDEQDEQARIEAIAKYDPRCMNPLDTLDTATLYSTEEAEYLAEMESNEELYETIRYLSSFDEVVDEWRAGELMRLRLHLEMRKAEIDRIWTCDRKLAWSTFIDDRAGELYRKAMAEVSHKKWQAEMELDLLAVHRKKTKGLVKLTKDILVPDVPGLEDDEEVKSLYRRFGKFVAVGARYTDVEDPLVRADLRKMRDALREQKKRSKAEKIRQAAVEVNGEQMAASQANGEKTTDATADADAVEAADADGAGSDASSYESDSEGYDSDSSYASSSSGISSLPSFSSVYSSPRLPSIADAEAPEILISTDDLEGLASEVASQLGAVDDNVSDEDADESLWARQIRLANQLAAESALPSGVQTPAAPASTAPSRATTPAPSGPTAKKPRGTKRKKRPPPPGARLWKKGRVQRDPTEEGDEPVRPAPPQQQEHDGGYLNGASKAEGDSRATTPPKAELEEPLRNGAFEHHAYGVGQQQFAAPSYSYPADNQYERGVRYDGDPYYSAEGARAGFGGQYAYPPPPPLGGAYTRTETLGYGAEGAQYRGRTPPLPELGQQGYYPSYAQSYAHQQQEYEQQQHQHQLEQGLEPGGYPSHHQQQQQPRPQWPY